MNFEQIDYLIHLLSALQQTSDSSDRHAQGLMDSYQPETSQHSDLESLDIRNSFSPEISSSRDSADMTILQIQNTRNLPDLLQKAINDQRLGHWISYLNTFKKTSNNMNGQNVEIDILYPQNITPPNVFLNQFPKDSGGHWNPSENDSYLGKRLSDAFCQSEYPKSHDQTHFDLCGDGSNEIMPYQARQSGQNLSTNIIDNTLFGSALLEEKERRMSQNYSESSNSSSINNSSLFGPNIKLTDNESESNQKQISDNSSSPTDTKGKTSNIETFKHCFTNLNTLRTRTKTDLKFEELLANYQNTVRISKTTGQREGDKDLFNLMFSGHIDGQIPPVKKEQIQEHSEIREEAQVVTTSNTTQIDKENQWDSWKQQIKQILKTESTETINFENVRRILTKFWLGKPTWKKVFTLLNQYELWIFGLFIWKRFGITELEQISSIEKLEEIMSNEKEKSKETMTKLIHKMFNTMDQKIFNYWKEDPREMIKELLERHHIKLNSRHYQETRQAYQIYSILSNLEKGDFKEFDFRMDILTGKAILKKDGTKPDREFLMHQDNWTKIPKIKAPDKISKAQIHLLSLDHKKRMRFTKYLTHCENSDEGVISEYTDLIKLKIRNKIKDFKVVFEKEDKSIFRCLEIIFKKVNSKKCKLPMTLHYFKKEVPKVLTDLKSEKNKTEYMAVKELHYWFKKSTGEEISENQA